MSSSAYDEESAGHASPARRPGQKQERTSEPLDNNFFALSGGILRTGPGARTSNRFEGLLGQMVSHPAAGTYSRDVERNLEFLHISLQLDMLSMIAQDGQTSRDSAPAGKKSNSERGIASSTVREAGP